MFESPWHIIILAVVIIVLFGGRKIPELMRGMGEGVRGFKEGMQGNPPSQSNTTQAQPPAASTEPRPEEKKS